MFLNQYSRSVCWRGDKVGNTQRVSLIFMCGKRGMNVQQYKIYHGEVIIPFVNQSYSKLTTWQEGDLIPNNL